MDVKSSYQTLVVLDLETTGLIHDNPKITELAMIAVNIETLQEMKNDEVLPRVLNKFVKNFNPLKELVDEVVKLTGLTNSMLSIYPPFDRQSVLAIETFLNSFPKPICFVAHNGNFFDFPIFFKEIQSALSNNKSMSTDDKQVDLSMATNNLSIHDSSIEKETFLFAIDCADSLPFFREMHRLLNDKDLVQYPDNNSSVVNLATTTTTTPTNNNHVGYVEIPIKYTPSTDPARQQASMKLSKIYEREFKDKASNRQSHRAEDDCLMLLALLKLYLPDWLVWVDENHRKLSTFHSYPTYKQPPPPKTVVNRKPPLKF